MNLMYIGGVIHDLFMGRSIALKQKRDQHIYDRFRYHRKRNPKWTIYAVLEEVSKEFFLSPVTVTKILKQRDGMKIPDPVTVGKHLKEDQPY